MKTCLGALLLVVLSLAISWICTCGILYLICLCFGFTFTWLIATGVWLLLVIVGSPVITITLNK